MARADDPGAVGDIYCADGDTVVQLDRATLEIVGTFARAGSNPQGMVFGPNGDLFLARQEAPFGQVREYNGATGAFVRTFAVVGDGSTMTDPWGMVFGPNGNLFVAVAGTAHEIREFDGTTGAFVGVFASGPELSGPTRLAFGGPNGNLFVTCGIISAAGDVLEYDGSTGAYVGIFASGLSGPQNATPCLAFGPNGNLFVGVNHISGQQGGAKVVELDGATGLVLQEFGTYLDSPKDMAFGPNGHLFVAETYAFPNGIREFDVSSGLLVNISEAIYSPSSLTFKPPCQPITPLIGSLSPIQTDNCSVLFRASITGTGLSPGCAEIKLTRAGEPNIPGFISGGVPLDSIGVDFVFDGDATGWWDLVVTYPADGQFDTLVNAIELVQTQACPAPQATAFDPNPAVNCSTLHDATISGVGFLPAYTFGAVVTLSKGPEYDKIVGTNVEVQSDTLITADFDLTGAAAGLWDVVVTLPDGTNGTTLAGGLEVATCLLGAEGDFYVGFWSGGSGGEEAGHKVMQLDGRTGQIVGDFVPSGTDGIDYVVGIAFGGPAGNLFLADRKLSNPANDRVLEFDGVTGSLVGTFATGPDVAHLRGLTFGSNGNLLVCTERAGAVLEFDTATGAPLGTFVQMKNGQRCYGLTFGPNGNLFVTATDPHSVLEFDGTTGALIGTFATIAGAMGKDLTFGGPHGNLFVSIHVEFASRILEYDGTTGALIGPFTGLLDNGATDGLAFGPNGNLFVATSGEGYGRSVFEYDGSTGDLLGVSEFLGNPDFLTFKPFSGSFPQPSLTALTPVQAGNCGVLVGATVTGTDLVWGAQLRLTRAGEADVVASSLEFVSDTQVTLNLELTAAAVGRWELVLTYPDGQTTTLADAIEVTLCPPPVVTGLAPGQVDNCVPLPGATITGSGFLAGSTLTLSQAGQADIVATDVRVQSDTTMVADFEVTMAAPGFWDLEVTHPGGSNSGALANALEISACPPPQVTDFSPFPAENCNWLVGATITGDWFTPGMTAVLSMSGEADIPGTSVDAASSTTIAVNFNLTGAPRGLWDLTVTRPDQQAATLPAGIEVVACQPQCRVFGNPEFDAGYAPGHLAYGDLDDDGDLDVVVTSTPSGGAGEGVSVLLNDGNGAFAPPVFYTMGKTPARVVIADLDGDGDLDLATANFHGSGNSNDDEEVSVLFNNGDGTFGNLALYPVTGTTPQGVAGGDLDGDGDLDLAVTHRSPHGVNVLLNNGDGTFVLGPDHAVSGSAHGVTAGDLDGDGDLDLAVAIDTQLTGGLAILLNNGDATFGPTTQYQGCSCWFPGGAFLALGDLDGDDDLDAVLGLTWDDGVAVFFNNGDGSFGNIMSYPVGIAPDGFGDEVQPRGVALGDLEGDGDPDLVVANSEDHNVSVLLNDGLGNLAPQVMYEAGEGPYGVTCALIDGDGGLDIVVANKVVGGISFLPNNGDGTFHTDVRYEAGDMPVDLASGDLDADGDPDLAVVNYGSSDISILLNEGGGTYAVPMDFPVGGEPRSVAVGDLNGDTALDLVVANSLSGEDDLSVLLGNGDGTFAPEVRVAVVGSGPWAVAAGDLDADGDLDLVTANQDSDDFSVLLGNGDGTFGAPAVYAGEGIKPQAVALADLNGDDYLDVAALSQHQDAGGPNLLLLVNNGDGTFLPGPAYRVGGNASSLEIADLDDDGDRDLVVTHTVGYNGATLIDVLLNHGNGTYADPVPYEPGVDERDFTPDVAIGDLDGDGALDLLATNSYGYRVRFLRGNGDGTFSPGTPRFYGVGDYPGGLVMDDLDGDGRLDVAVANRGDYGSDSAPKPSVSVLLNRCSVPEEVACCFSASSCAQLTQDECTLLGGTVRGPNTLCPTQNVGMSYHAGPDMVVVHWTDAARNCHATAGKGLRGACTESIDAWVSAARRDCCDSHGYPGCDDIECESAVCAIDPNCCDDVWDEACAALAAAECGNLCDDHPMCHHFGDAYFPYSPPIPADFFGTGSDAYGSPIAQEVCLRGEPLGQTPYGYYEVADTLIRRELLLGDPFDRCESPSGESRTVDIEIVALNLKSSAPITVTYNGGQNPEQWDVAVDLSEVAPAYQSTLTAYKTHCNGGTYDTELYVQARFTFTKVSDPGEVRYLDTGLEGLDAIPLAQNVDNWVADVDPNMSLESEWWCTDFHPGIEDRNPTTDCDCNGNGMPDTCETDTDADGVINDCDGDDDNDGVPDGDDTDASDPDVCRDADNDGCDDCSVGTDDFGPLSDADPANDGPYSDLDGVCDAGENCEVFNPEQLDCLPNGIGDVCDIADGTSQDCDLDGVPDSCGMRDCAGDSACDDCNTNNVPDWCDIDAGSSTDSNGNGTPDDCELQPTLPPAPPHNTAKHRYFSIDASTNAPIITAIRVELIEMRRCSSLPSRACSIDDDCEPAVPGSGVCIEHADVGTAGPWWVQAAQQEPLGCIPVSCGDYDWFARLDGVPYFDTWAQSTLHIGDCEVIPLATYEIRVCAPPDGLVCSDALTIGTIGQPFISPGFRGNYGDVVGPADAVTEAFVPPDGFTNVIDISAYILTKQNYGTSDMPQTHPTWVDLHGLGDGNPPQPPPPNGNPPNYILNVSDLGQILKAIAGDAWTDDPGNMNPGECP